MLASILDAIEDIKAGRFVIIVDDESRENEGDLAMAAEKVTPEAINFMAKYGRGLICFPIAGQRLDELGIPLMVTNNPRVTALLSQFLSRPGIRLLPVSRPLIEHKP